jgi:hypothetical protein
MEIPGVRILDGSSRILPGLNRCLGICYQGGPRVSYDYQVTSRGAARVSRAAGHATTLGEKVREIRISRETQLSSGKTTVCFGHGQTVLSLAPIGS